MNSGAEGMSTKEQQRALVPRLRFPEFRQEPAWIASRLGSLATIVKGKGVSKADIKSDGALPAIRYAELYTIYGEVIREVVSRTNLDAENLVLSERDDVLIPASGETKADIATAACLPIARVALGSDLNVIRSSLHGPFFSYYLNGSKRADIARVAQGDTVAHLYPTQLQKVVVHYPKRAEQQKIADCLGSLDDLIAAERRKLAALRDHKQGLMQQLFPREGETRPRLRFPEFQGAGDWEVCAVGNIAKIFKGKGVAKADIVAGGLTPCIRYAELYTTYGEVITDIKSYTDVSVSALVLSETEDVIIPASGETKADIATCACVASAGVALGSDLNVLRSKVDGRFLSYYLNGVKRPELAKVAQGDTVAHLYQAQISQLTVAIPTDAKEQRVIADCLSTIDGQISVKVAKLNALRTHKHGLMQQLFPASDSAV